VSQYLPDQEPFLLGEEMVSLFQRYGRALFAYVRLHALSREDCKDITLEVFQIALRYDDLSQISEAERFTWLRRVASHKIVDRRRRTTRYPETTLETVAETLFNAESSDPESIVLQEEAHIRLRHLIRRLPVPEQQLLRLRYGDRLSFAQIGQLLERKETAVRKHHSRILARLRTLYEPEKGV
jgi:RNA polymerase sigma factor (sigma-70 family)